MAWNSHSQCTGGLRHRLISMAPPAPNQPMLLQRYTGTPPCGVRDRSLTLAWTQTRGSRNAGGHQVSITENADALQPVAPSQPPPKLKSYRMSERFEIRLATPDDVDAI